jgi:hypothetical protein
MEHSNKYKFMQQQGFKVTDEASTQRHFDSLLFQPVIVGSLLMISIIFQLEIIFLSLGVILWINTLFPGLNPFERFYDLTIGRINNYPPLPPAPAPRRFMQGMAGTLMLLTGFFLLQNWMVAAYITEGFIAITFSLLLFGKFCIGAYIYHSLKGNKSFADVTSPWNT